MNKLRIPVFFSFIFFIKIFCIYAQNDTKEIESNLPKDKKWKLVWNDEFNGHELDSTKWGFRLHIMQNRYNTYTTEGVEVKEGLLYLNLIEKDGQYYSSQLQTGQNFLDRPGSPYTDGLTWPIADLQPPKFVHKYGYYEIRCKQQEQPGWGAAFWLQSPVIGSSLDPSKAGVELDIMEDYSRDGKFDQNVHWGGYGKNHETVASGPIKLPESEDGFHTFGMHWSKSGYIFYVDGKETWRVDGPVSDAEQFILVSTECKGYRHGSRDQPSPELKKAILPDAFIVDYVRVFDEVE
ncbi:glycoside hydrolase family 16 protein [Arenibacter algicola]|uniref:glycoside hydrolase family 16 protein n=1 Tax=Arenibacter algicola TaxID=616991 RepID=UPI001C0683C6|nr:glycoside hydrolase family 16 protein [Arenibacter algicola]MBU2904068.1 glycoside hydrolase family 16 protein [Arenibacter algicola]